MRLPPFGYKTIIAKTAFCFKDCMENAPAETGTFLLANDYSEESRPPCCAEKEKRGREGKI